MCMGGSGRFGLRVLLVLAFTGLGLTAGCLVEGAENSTPESEAHLKILSGSFAEGETISIPPGCIDHETSPALRWSGVPARTACLAIVMEDLDIPWLRFTHWIVYNIPPSSAGIPPDITGDPVLSDGSIQGLNDFHMIGYRGPCPPRGNAHRYRFTVYALDRFLDGSEPMDRTQFNNAIDGAVIGQGAVTGIYCRT